MKNSVEKIRVLPIRHASDVKIAIPWAKVLGTSVVYF